MNSCVSCSVERRGLESNHPLRFLLFGGPLQSVFSHLPVAECGLSSARDLNQKRHHIHHRLVSLPVSFLQVIGVVPHSHTERNVACLLGLSLHEVGTTNNVKNSTLPHMRRISCWENREIAI